MTNIQKILIAFASVLALVLLANQISNNPENSIVGFLEDATPVDSQEETEIPFFETQNFSEVGIGFPFQMPFIVVDRNEEKPIEINLASGPDWMSIEECIRAFTDQGQEMECLLKGEYDQAGEYSFSISAQDSLGGKVVKDFTLNITE